MVLLFSRRAHVEVQQWLDEADLAQHIFSIGMAAEIHRRFCALLPEDMLWVEDPASVDRLKKIKRGLSPICIYGKSNDT